MASWRLFVHLGLAHRPKEMKFKRCEKNNILDELLVSKSKDSNKWQLTEFWIHKQFVELSWLNKNQNLIKDKTGC